MACIDNDKLKKIHSCFKDEDEIKNAYKEMKYKRHTERNGNKITIAAKLKEILKGAKK